MIPQQDAPIRLSFMVTASFDEPPTPDNLTWYADQIRDVLNAADCAKAQDYQVVPVQQQDARKALIDRAIEQIDCLHRRSELREDGSEQCCVCGVQWNCNVEPVGVSIVRRLAQALSEPSVVSSEAFDPNERVTMPVKTVQAFARRVVPVPAKMRPPTDDECASSETQEQRSEPQDSLLNPAHQVYFRAGLIACREYMARFVEAQHPAIAQSIRANWWPSLGADFGPPRLLEFGELTEGEYETPSFRCKTAEEVSPTMEALPVALIFLDSRAMAQPSPSQPSETPQERKGE